MPTEAVSPDDVAEDLHPYLPVGPNHEREDRGDVVLIMDRTVSSPLFCTASRIRFGPDPQVQVDAVRAWFARRDRKAFTWYLGPHTTPANLEGLLRSHGAAPDPAEPEHTALVLDHEPPESPHGVTVRRVETYEDFVASASVMSVGFGGSFTPEELSEMEASLPQEYDEYQAQSLRRRYLALIDEEPVSTAQMAMSDVGVAILAGGATLPAARGKGAYRALVRARWDEAIAAGATALVTQASELSRPVLERMGFRPVGPVLELIDAVT